MKILLFSAIGLLLFSPLSISRGDLGETLDQCIARYGQPVPTPEIQPPKGIGSNFVLFQKDGFNFAVVIFNGTVGGEDISKLDKSAISESQKRTLLHSQSNTKSWLKIADSTADEKYKRDDNGAYAIYVTRSHEFCFYSADYYAALTGKPAPALADTAPPVIGNANQAPAGVNDLVTKDGKIYRYYKLVGFTNMTLDIANEKGDGLIQIPYKNLPDDLRHKYDPEVTDAKRNDEYIQSELKLRALIAPAVAKASTDYSSTTKVTVTGQVFIATQGGDNIKLGGIHVQLYSEDELQALIIPVSVELLKQQQYLQEYLENYKQIDQPTLEALQHQSIYNPQYTYPSLGSELNQEQSNYEMVAYRKKTWLESARFFNDLPSPLTDSQTDADGKFSISVPNTGNYVLVARGSRDTGASEERYYWMVRLPMNNETSKNVLLTNENMTTTGSPDSLVKCSQ